MRHKDLIILKKILSYCDECEEACLEFDNSFEKFSESSVFRNACCMCVLQIGELCKNVSMEMREEYPQIPWRTWCGVRDIFAHQYSNLDINVAWGTITKDIPLLRSEIRLLIKMDQ